MAKHDITALKRALPLPELMGRCGVELRADGREFKALCPFHDERTPSFSVFPTTDGHHRFECFGCGAKGDAIQFLQDRYSLSPREALDRLAEMAGSGYTPANDNAPAKRQGKAREQKPDAWVPGIAPTDEPAPPTLRIQREGKWIEVAVVAAWPYRDAEGNLISYACRVELEPGKKDVIPVLWKVNTDTGEARWKQGSLPKPRLLYGTELLAANPEAQVVLVEGEKATDAARRMLEGTGIISVTWPGGCKAVEHADWALLKGRKVLGWPDTDSQAYAENHPQAGELKPYTEQPGMAAMLRIAELVAPLGAEMRILEVPKPGLVPNGWDAADALAEGWDQERLFAWIGERVRMPAEIAAAEELDGLMDEPPLHTDVPPLDLYADMEREADGEAPPPPASDREPFRILGWDRGCAYYLPDGFRQVVELSPSSHTKLNLLQLAPMHHWEAWFASGKKTGEKVSWDMAAESLIRRAQRQGVWDPDLVRGRGAWWDRGRPVVHVGDRLIIDGNPYSLHDAPTGHVYEVGRPFSIATENPLTNSEAHKFVQLCQNPRWERAIFGKLLAGWVFLAPICGALQWRPHIWVTGGAGSGKSTVMNYLINLPLGKTKLAVTGDTSEAGIRRTLGMDAIPVVFEEFDSENKHSADRVERVMALVTQASSEGEGKIIKANNTGGTDGFSIRSMFAFNSIAVNLSQFAARTRVTVLSLMSQPETPEGVEQYQRYMHDIHETLTPDYINRMQARAVSLIPVIRKNAETFAKAAAITLRSRRFGDQIGTLLAGVYALHSTKEISDQAALEWIQQQSWDEEREANETKDEQMCMAHILSFQLRVETRSGGPKTRTIAELMERVACIGEGGQDGEVTSDEAYDTMKRHGIRVDRGAGGHFYARIAVSHRELKRMLDGTPWALSWGRTLRRLHGAGTCTTRFGSPSKAVEIDVRTILGVSGADQGELADF